MKKIVLGLFCSMLLLTSCSSNKKDNSTTDIVQDSAFISVLDKNANLRWNICTEADKTVSLQAGNFVLYFMYNSSDYDTNAINWGDSFTEAFKDAVASSSSCKEIGDKLIESAPDKELSLVNESVTEGYLPGFDADITGFKDAAVVAPIIGSIPFIAYVFELE